MPKKRFASSEKKKGSIDEQTVFYIAKKILAEEYGLRGVENIIPTRFQEQKLYLSARSSLWGNEIFLEKERLREKINTLLGGGVIQEIKIDRG